MSLRITKILFFCGLFFVAPNLYAQLTVTSTELSFGTFTRLNGGTVTISTEGERTKSGDIILLNSTGIPSSAGSFSFTTKLGASKEINIIKITPSPLTNNTKTGVGSLELTIILDPTTPFTIDKDNPGTVKFGGTITIGSEDQPGVYGGSVLIDFIYQ